MADHTRELYIGLMSGTSVDGIDVAIVDFTLIFPRLIARSYTPYPAELRNRILALCKNGTNEILRFGELDIILAKEFAHAINQLLANHQLTAPNIKAIGSHGQTIRHSPNSIPPFTLQIGDPNTIAALTGITTVADFRRKDMAYGGQGAPLVPVFHHELFSHDTARIVVNIGGIANITCLIPQQPLIGFDTGPGNVLLDAWIEQHLQKTYDKEGRWAATGKMSQSLLTSLMTDHYFQLSAPKSTGREYFNLPWLEKHLALEKKSLTPADVQATLTELTAHSILEAVKHYCSQGELIICGGGAHNLFLMTRLRELAQSFFIVNSTSKYGISPDDIEAMAFAWLAKKTLNKEPGNHPNITGAHQFAILGGIYLSP